MEVQEGPEVAVVEEVNIEVGVERMMQLGVVRHIAPAVEATM